MEIEILVITAALSPLIPTSSYLGGSTILAIPSFSLTMELSSRFALFKSTPSSTSVLWDTYKEFVQYQRIITMMRVLKKFETRYKLRWLDHSHYPWWWDYIIEVYFFPVLHHNWSQVQIADINWRFTFLASSKCSLSASWCTGHNVSIGGVAGTVIWNRINTNYQFFRDNDL